MNYVGTELELFRHAVKWKRYWSRAVKPFVRGRVLDVGCGLGVNAEHVNNAHITAYTFLEPDAALLKQVPQHVRTNTLPNVACIAGTTAQVSGRTFDTLLYIDVLEHIEDPVTELRRASELLSSGGHLVIVVPAFQFLYSPFDRAIGHHRRYTKAMLREQLPQGLVLERVRYLDSVGLLLSLGNKIALRKAAPTMGQITFWDRTIVPLSRIVDRLVLHTFGRSLMAVYRKP